MCRIKLTFLGWAAAFLSAHVALHLATLPGADWRWVNLHVCSYSLVFKALRLTRAHVVLGVLHSAFYMAAAFGDPGTVTAQMHESGTDCDWKQCETCNIARPFRAKHCPERGCSRCVSRFDHFCGFLDTAVGAGNEVPFMAFCFFAFMDCSLASVNSVWVLLSPSDGLVVAPGLLEILQSGRLLSMDSVSTLWQRRYVVRGPVCSLFCFICFF
jgi:hypothetical protein